MKHPVPLEVLDQHLLVLGKTGSGKSFATRGLVERLVREGRRGFVLDYTGVWWGLRSSRDGRGPGLPAVIFGGPHADVALNEHAGGAIAEYIAASDGWSIIDLDGLTPAQQQRFVTAFLQELYRLNKRPLHCVLEEIDEFCPMTSAAGAETMIGAVARVFQRGRVKGLRAIAITQRPANLHTRVRAQCNAIVLMKLMAPQDRKAVQDWVRGQADEEKGREVIDSLPQLARGEAWVWAPEQNILNRVTMPDIGTFDSMRTPKEGEIKAPRERASIDLDGVKAKMAAAVQEAAASDPRRLREQLADRDRRIKDLERQIASAKPAKEDPEKFKARVEAAVKAFVTGHKRTLAAAVNQLRKATGRVRRITEANLTDIDANIDALMPSEDDLQYDGSPELHPGPEREASRRQAMRVPASAERKTGTSDSEGRLGSNTARLSDGAHIRLPEGAGPVGSAPEGLTINRAQQRVLDALAFLAATGQTNPDSRAVGLLAGIDPTGGYFSNTVGPLSQAGVIVRFSGQMALTDLGRPLARPPNVGLSLAEYHRSLLEVVQKKSGASRRLLEKVIELGGQSVSSEDLGRMAGIDHSGGYFSNSIGPLSTLGLIERRGGMVTPTHVLFPEGLA